MGKKADRPIPVRLDDTVTLTIDRLGYRGEGVARYDGFTVFVDGALPGEEVIVRIEAVQPSYAQARVLSLLTPSPSRTKPPCAVYEACGGCQLQHASYDAQVAMKEQAVIDSLTRIGKWEEQDVRSLLSPLRNMEEPWRYRNKVTLSFALDAGRLVAGYVKEGSHDVVEAPECLLRPVSFDQVSAFLTEQLDDFGFVPYEEDTRRGDLRQLVLRENQEGELMVILVMTTLSENKLLTLCRRADAFCRQEGYRLGSFVVHVAPPGTKAIWAREGKVLWGKAFLNETIGDLPFRLSSRSFMQVNERQMRVLYDEARKAAQLTEQDTVWDLYCGIGTITLLAAQHAKHVTGIEVVEEAAADAKQNARRNGLTNVTFLAGDAEKLVTDRLENGDHPDVVLLDPPRAGCDRTVLEGILRAAPQRIVYVSCNPATLARDLRILADGGYALRSIVPVDMFPQTSHVECVVLMSTV